MMTVDITCENCNSSVEVFPDLEATKAKCDICEHVIEVEFDSNHLKSELTDCPVCARKDFYTQKDFNRIVGVSIFIVAAITSIWTYGLSFFVIYGIDFLLFRKLRYIAICYKCTSIFRGVNEVTKIPGYNHEMNDRIVYADHDFKGIPLDH
jgi:hypothetical protein